MTTIGTLTIEMAANVARLQQDLQAARGSVDSTFQSIGSSVAKLKMLVGTVFAGIAVGSLLEAVDKVKTAAVDIERIAAASGASLDEFQRAAAGAKTVGVNFEKFGDIMKDTQDKLGDFLVTGGGELKDFFETIGPKVGVTAESFRNLSGPQALQLFYTSLEKAGVGQKVMIQQMESIANDASALAPLLANGGAEFKKLGDEAAKAGALMSGELIYASKALNEEMMRMDTVTVGISNAIMSGVIPALTEMATASREELSAGFEAVSAWVQDNKEQLVGAWEIAKQLAAEVWSIVKVAAELAVGIAAWAVESGFLEASLITVGLLIAGAKDGVDIIGAAFAKLGSIILNAVAKPMSGFLNDVGVVLKWAGQGDLAGVFLDAAEGIKTAGDAGAQYAAGVADKFAAGDTAVARFTAGLGASTQAAQAAAKSTYTAYQALGTGAGISAKAAEEAKKSADKAAAAAQKLAEEGVKLAASLLAQDSGLSGDFAAKWDKLNAAYRAGAVSLADLTQAQKLLLAEQPAMQAAVEERRKQLDDEAAAWTDVRKAMAAYGQAQEQAAQGVADGNRSLREEIELIGLSSKEQTRVLQQRTQAIVLTKQHTLAEMERQAVITGTMTREQIALAAEIEGLQERNELLGAQEARESWTGFWESVNSTAHDTFVNVAEEGMGAFKRIGKTLKSAVLDMLYQMTIKKWIVSISGSMAGALAGGAAQAATGGGGAGSALNAASTIGSLSSGVGLLGAGGLGLQAGFGALMSSGFAGIGASVTGGMAAIASGTGAGIAAGLGTIAGALGPIALGIGAVFSIIKKFDNSGTLHMGAGAIYSAERGLQGGAGLYGRSAFGQGASNEYSAKSQANVDSIARGIGMALDSVAVSFGRKAGYEIATAFADDSSKDGAWGSLRISQAGKDLMNWEDTRKSKWAPKEFGDGEAGYKEYLAAVARDTRQVLLDMDLPSWADTMLASIGEAADMDALTAVIDQIAQVQAAFEQMGKTLDGFAGMSDAAFEALVRASGGIEALASSAAGYYENYYSEAERMGKATASLAAELAKSGVSMPASKEAYRALVEEQLKAGESGAVLAAKLLQLSPVFAEVSAYAEQAALDTAQAAKDASAALLDSVGISAADMGKTFRDVLLGRTDAAEAGAALADSVTGGIYNAIAGGAAQQLTDLMMTSLITPVVQAAVAGTAISEAVSQSAIDSMVQQAQRAAAVLGQIFSDPVFLAAIASVDTAIRGVVSAAGAGIKPYSPAVVAAASSAGDSYARDTAEPLKNAWEDLIATIVRSTQDAVRELSRLGMTSYESALASIQDKAQEQVRSLQDAGYMRTERERLEQIRPQIAGAADLLERWRRQGSPDDAPYMEALKQSLASLTSEFGSLSEALSKLPAEVQAMVDAETALLKARNAATAKQTTDALIKEQGQIGMSAVAREFQDLTEKALEYVAGLRDLGQATTENLAVVSSWSGAMRDQIRQGAYDQLLSPDQLKARDSTKLGADFASLGQSMPQTTEAFREIIDAARELGNITLADSLLELVPAFVSLQGAVGEVVDGMTAAMRQLKSETANLEIALMRAQGNTAGANGAQRAIDIEDLTQAEIAIYDYNAALKAQITTLEERNGLQEQLNQLTLTSAELRALEIAKLDESNRALQQQIWELEDAKRIAQERIGLENQLLQLLGNTTELRRRELAALDASNRALQLHIYAVEDAIKATDDAYAALEEGISKQRTAAQDTASEIGALFDYMRDQAKSLRQEIDSTRKMSAAQGNSFIQNALSNVRATGYMPELDDLRGAVDSVRAAIEAGAYSTQFEADRDRLVLAGQLQELADAAEPQLTIAEQQLKVMDESLAAAKEQIDVLRGLKKYIVDDPQAAAQALQDAIAKEEDARLAAAQAVNGSAVTADDFRDFLWLGGSVMSRQMIISMRNGSQASEKARAELSAVELDAWKTFGQIQMQPGWAEGLTAIGLNDFNTALSKRFDAATGMLDLTDVGGALISLKDSLKYMGDAREYLYGGKSTVIGAYGSPATDPEVYTASPPQTMPKESGNGSDEIVTELRALREQNASLEARLAGIEKSSAASAEILDSVTEGGNVMRTEVMA